MAHGATSEILFEAHPHIGTNKLPKLVTALRDTVEQAGGEVHFDTKVTDFVIDNDEMVGVVTEKLGKIKGVSVVLATGHSARDVFRLCKERNIFIEAKPFALGVRVEHPQRLIDQIQYKCEDRGAYLPASAYSLVSQTSIKGVGTWSIFFFVCVLEVSLFQRLLRQENLSSTG